MHFFWEFIQWIQDIYDILQMIVAGNLIWGWGV
jgi:hypothetical protein